jgi:hypothetical protein
MTDRPLERPAPPRRSVQTDQQAEAIMAWIEQIGAHSWRVRYIRGDGSIASVSGFASRTAAEDHAAAIQIDQRRGARLAPAPPRITFADWAGTWLTSLDLDVLTVENYHSRLRCHLLPRWGQAALGRDLHPAGHRLGQGPHPGRVRTGHHRRHRQTAVDDADRRRG